MAQDTDLRQGLSAWRQHAVAAGITLLPLLIAAAVAWGTLTTKVQASDAKLQLLEVRVTAVEKQTAVVESQLLDIKESQNKIDEKLDKLLGRR